MIFDIFSLQCFVQVAKHKNITKASAVLLRTQSAVSQQISKLENNLSRKLFLKDKAITLTSDGEIFLSYANKILDMCNELHNRFQEPKVEGEIRFGLPENFANAYLSDILINFTKKHPSVALNIECDLTLNLFEKFKKNELDLVLVKMNKPEDFPNGVDVLSEKLVWVGCKNLITKQSIPLILAPDPCVYRKAAIDALNHKNIPWRIALSSASHVNIISAVRASLGITCMPKNMHPKDLDIIDDDLIAKLPDSHLSLLKKSNNNVAINTLEKFVLGKIK
jgi:DNA-binding transcriptional LysR family regulator